MDFTAQSSPSGQTILHVSADFPDHFAPAKTPAIRNVINLVKDRFEHRILSLNRVAPGFDSIARLLTGHAGSIAASHHDDNVTSLQYYAAPKGILHQQFLMRLADTLYDQICIGPRPDLIVGHKLTIEGLVVAELSRRLDIPYAITLQGNTDCRIIAARPDLRKVFAQVLADAAVVFSFAPWALNRIQLSLGIHAVNAVHLPCPVALDVPITPTVGCERMLTAFHLQHYRLKNFKRLTDSLRRARSAVPDLALNVIGGGSAQQIAAVQRIADRAGGVSLLGHVENAALGSHYNQALAFALPSLRESFGMVFVEALFCGSPILYSRQRAVSGWFDGAPFAVDVDPHDTFAIAEGLLRLWRDERLIKTALAHWQGTPAAHRFMRQSIAETFGNALQTAASGAAALSVMKQDAA